MQDWGCNGKLDKVIEDICALLNYIGVLLVQEWGDHEHGCPHNTVLAQRVAGAGFRHLILHNQAYVCLAHLPGFQLSTTAS